MDIFDQLLIDHDRQRDLVGRILEEAGGVEARWGLLGELHDELLSHAAAEEQTLYACLLADFRPEIQSNVLDHDLVAEVVAQLHQLDPGGAEWLSQAVTLKAALESHLDLEEAQLIPSARALLPSERGRLLGERFALIKQSELQTWGSVSPVRRMAPA